MFHLIIKKTALKKSTPTTAFLVFLSLLISMLSDLIFAIFCPKYCHNLRQKYANICPNYHLYLGQNKP